MSDQDLATLTEMFSDLDPAVIKIVLEECKTLELSISKILEMTDPAHDAHDAKNNVDSLAEDEQLAYATALQMQEEGEVEEEEVKEKQKKKQEVTTSVKSRRIRSSRSPTRSYSSQSSSSRRCRSSSASSYSR